MPAKILVRCVPLTTSDTCVTVLILSENVSALTYPVKSAARSIRPVKSDESDAALSLTACPTFILQYPRWPAVSISYPPSCFNFNECSMLPS